MKTPDSPVSSESSARPRLPHRLPEPARMLRLARLLIPLCLLVGLGAEPFLHWLIPILSGLPLRLPSFLL